MVIRSNINYIKWKRDVKKIYSEKFGKEKGEKFIKWVSSIYDKYNKSFLPHKVLWRIFDLHMKVINNNQHQVYGAFGRGGYGKSTLIKNILYAHDPTFTIKRIATSMDGFIDVLYDVLRLPNNGKFKAILIDEPSKTTHQASESWRMTEDVLGQIRQANLIVGICATELRNIKSTMFSLVTGMYAFRKYYVYDYYDEEKTEGIMGEIIKEYKKTNTYEVFHKKYIFKKAYIKNMKSSKYTPIIKQEKKYDKKKREEFMQRVENLRKTRKVKSDTWQMDAIDKIILKKRKAGLKLDEIGKALEMTKQSVYGRLKEMRKHKIYVVPVKR